MYVWKPRGRDVENNEKHPGIRSIKYLKIFYSVESLDDSYDAQSFSKTQQQF
jgi:hypothetical protein